MSLDVYLYLANPITGDSERCIAIRIDGRVKTLTCAEWDALHPGIEPFIQEDIESDWAVFCANITHNLNEMADAAGIYQHLWRPEELGITMAVDLIAPLREGLCLLVSDRQRFEAFNPSNGWGSYDGLVDFVSEYLKACEKYPQARVSVSR